MTNVETGATKPVTSGAENQRIADSPHLLSVKKIDEDGRVKITFRTVRGRSAKAVFAANDDVESALDRWNESGMLEMPDREILNDHSLEGWAAGPVKAAQSIKAQEVKARIKEYKLPPMSAKEARLAKEAKLIANYKDQYRGYWVVIAIVTVVTLTLMGLASSLNI